MTNDAFSVFSAFDFSRMAISLSVLILAFILAKSCKILSARTARAFPDYRLRIEQIITMGTSD
jgi:hypothetical protein